MFPMIKARPNCFDNIKDLAVPEHVRALLGADKGWRWPLTQINSGNTTEICQWRTELIGSYGGFFAFSAYKHVTI